MERERFIVAVADRMVELNRIAGMGPGGLSVMQRVAECQRIIDVLKDPAIIARIEGRS